MIRHVEKQPWGKRVIGWHPGYGIYAEWHYFGSWSDQMPDTGQAMARCFRKWLREKYVSEAHLRKAWNDPEITFEEAKVPGVEPRAEGTLISFRDPSSERWVMDYYQCQQQITAHCLQVLAQIMREETEGRCFCGAYYGYFFGVRPQTQGGHLELENLLRLGTLDYYVAPYCYAYRKMGEDARLRAGAEAFRLGGSVHCLEGDTRTHLHPRNEYGRTQNLEESLAAIRREFTTALTEGAAFWFVDFGPNGMGGWFDDPHIMGEIEKLYALAARCQAAKRRRTAEMALVYDLNSAYVLSDTEGMSTAQRLIEGTTTALHRTGAPFDVFLASQLERADLDRYKLLIFLNLFALDNETADRLVNLRGRKDLVLLWLWAPGLFQKEGISLDQASRVTGFDLRLHRGRLPGTVQIVAPEDPLVSSLPEKAAFQWIDPAFKELKDVLELSRWYNPRDEKTMERWFREYQVEAEGDAIVWTFDTDYAWNDVHARVDIPKCDGVGLDLKVQGDIHRLLFCLVLKDADGAEFACPREPIQGENWCSKQYAVSEWTNAPWSTQKPSQPSWPLQGFKLVLYGTAGEPCTVHVRKVGQIFGKTKIVGEKSFGDGLPFGPALLSDDGIVLGTIRDEAFPILVRDEEAHSVFLGAPCVPRSLLTGLMDEAGVHRYLRQGEDVVRGDAHLLAIHTREGGERDVFFPEERVVRDAVTGKRVGSGKRIHVNLPPASTAIWSMGE